MLKVLSVERARFHCAGSYCVNGIRYNCPTGTVCPATGLDAYSTCPGGSTALDPTQVCETCMAGTLRKLDATQLRVC